MKKLSKKEFIEAFILGENVYRLGHNLQEVSYKISNKCPMSIDCNAMLSLFLENPDREITGMEIFFGRAVDTTAFYFSQDSYRESVTKNKRYLKDHGLIVQLKNRNYKLAKVVSSSLITKEK